MKAVLIMIPVLLLSGCVSPYRGYNQSNAYAECKAIADSGTLEGPYLDSFMRQCVQITPRTPASSYSQPSYAGGGYGPDNYGPYGLQGPTWDEFNRQFRFQQHQRPAMILPPNR